MMFIIIWWFDGIENFIYTNTALDVMFSRGTVVKLWNVYTLPYVWNTHSHVYRNTSTMSPVNETQDFKTKVLIKFGVICVELRPRKLWNVLPYMWTQPHVQNTPPPCHQSTKIGIMTNSISPLSLFLLHYLTLSLSFYTIQYNAFSFSKYTIRHEHTEGRLSPTPLYLPPYLPFQLIWNKAHEPSLIL